MHFKWYSRCPTERCAHRSALASAAPRCRRATKMIDLRAGARQDDPAGKHRPRGGWRGHCYCDYSIKSWWKASFAGDRSSSQAVRSGLSDGEDFTNDISQPQGAWSISVHLGSVQSRRPGARTCA